MFITLSAENSFFSSKKAGNAVSKHFDAWGTPILDFFGMIRWYRADPDSLAVIRRLPSFRYVVIPDVELTIELPEAVSLEIRCTWPCGSIINRKILGERVIDALRRLYVSSEVEWRVSRAEKYIIWKRKGKVIPALWSNYYPTRQPQG